MTLDERTTNVKLNLVELNLLNNLMQYYKDNTSNDEFSGELKLKLSKAFYNIVRQEYRNDKRQLDNLNKKVIEQVHNEWANKHPKENLMWLINSQKD